MDKKPPKSESFYAGGAVAGAPVGGDIFIARGLNTLSRDVTVLPPKQQLGQRTLNVSGLELVQTENGEGYTAFTLTWDYTQFLNIYSPVFRIYADTGLSYYWRNGSATTDNQGGNFQLYQYADKPPCRIVIPGYDQRRVIFRVQTQQLNGYVSDFDSAPIVAGLAEPLEGRIKYCTAAYTCLPGDRTIIGDATSAGFSVTLLNTAVLPEGFTYTVKKNYADASGNSLTVQGSNTAQTIDGATTNVLTTAGTVRRYRKSGSIWEIV